MRGTELTLGREGGTGASLFCISERPAGRDGPTVPCFGPGDPLVDRGEGGAGETGGISLRGAGLTPTDTGSRASGHNEPAPQT
jgi:hypothetical protein